MAHLAHRRIFDRVARIGGFALDTGEHMQIFHVLAPQHLHERLRTHHAEDAALPVHHGQGIHPVMQRERCRALLVRIGCDTRKIGLHDIGQQASASSEQPRQRHHADKAAIIAGHQHQFDIPGFLRNETREHGRGTVLRTGPQHRRGNVTRDGFVMLHFAGKHASTFAQALDAGQGAGEFPHKRCERTHSKAFGAPCPFSPVIPYFGRPCLVVYPGNDQST